MAFSHTLLGWLVNGLALALIAFVYLKFRPKPAMKTDINRRTYTAAALLLVRERLRQQGALGEPLGYTLQDRKAHRAARRHAASEDAAAPASAAPADGGAATLGDDKKQLESLLNFVASQPRERRVFVTGDEVPPPPPPEDEQPKQVTPQEALQMNNEAQRILKAATTYGKKQIVKGVYQKLLAHNVRISVKTYTMLIEGALAEEDLAQASELILRMEGDGYAPRSTLLTKVMDLYAAEKARKASAKQQQKKISLSFKVDAPEFVPGKPAAEKNAEAEKTLARAVNAPVFVPSGSFAPYLQQNAWQPPPPPPPPPVEAH